MGGSRTNVQAPQESAEQRAYWAQLAEDARYAREKQQLAAKAEESRKAALRAAGISNLGSYSDIFQRQLSSGALTASRAEEELTKFQQKYGLEASDVAKQIQAIRQYETEQIPIQRETLIQRAYQDFLGRKASAEELSSRLNEIAKSGGKIDLDAIGSSLKSSDEYRERVGGSYLENYYKTYYGPSETKTVKGVAGAPDWQKSTGRYTVNLSSAFTPVLDADLEKQVGLRFGEAPKSITGTVAEIEQAQQSLRQRSEFAYNSGLLKLQGEIDSNIQNIKNKGARDVAEITSRANVYSNLTSGFW